MWKKLRSERKKAKDVLARKLAKLDTSKIDTQPDVVTAITQDYHIAIEDATFGQHDLVEVVTAIRRDFDSLSAASPLVSDALHGYFLNTIVLYAGDRIDTGCYAGGMADFEGDEGRLYIAAGRLLDYDDHTLHVGDGSHNVCKDFRSILAHEMGHLVMPKFEDQIREKFKIIYDQQPQEFWEDNVSTYAGTDDHELFAESFCAWNHPDYEDGMLPKILEDVLNGVDMMKFDWPRLRKISPTDDDDGHSAAYSDNNDQGDITITTDGGLTFTTDMVDGIIDEVKNANWFVLTGTISPTMMQAFKDAGYSELVAAGAGTDSKMFSVSAAGAEKYAAEHSADLVSNITDTTRSKLRTTIEDAVKEGWGNEELQAELEANFAFGAVRADLIARNELSLAYARGRIEASRTAGAIGKRWLLSSDHDPKEDCQCSEAAEAGMVDYEDSFVEGDDDYWWAPGHINCQCDTKGVYPGQEDDDSDSDGAGDDGEDDEDDAAEKMAKYDRAFDAALDEQLAKYADDEERDEHGRWTAGGGSAFKYDAKAKAWSGGTAHENARLAALKVPPAWANVRLNPDAKGDKQAMGVDKKGRTQAIYSAEYRAGQDAAKFERLKEFNKAVPAAVEKLRSDMNNKSLPAATRDAAAATYLISQTGIRIGSTKETGADKKAYGASTLEGRHIKVSGDTVSLSFVGKKGVAQKMKFEDADLAKYIGDKGAQRSTKVFSATTDAHIRDYFHKTVGDEFVVKDFRTWTGTATALRAVAGMKSPKTETEYKKGVKAVAKIVSEKLGNTPTIALKSYIDPTVFKSWSKHLEKPK